MSKYKKLLKNLDIIAEEGDDDLIGKLLTKPARDKNINTPNVHVNTRNFIHQADTLYVPHDKRYKYIVVVIDLATNHMDAKPVKTKNSTEAAKVMKEMYKGPHLKQPKVLEVDSGTEFKGDFPSYFKNMTIRTKRTQRHRAQASVEGMNSLVSRLLNRLMLKETVKTGKESVKWVDNLPKVVIEINKLLTKKPSEIDPVKNMPKCAGRSCNLIKVGSRVRIILEAPEEFINKKRLIGKFREGDVRWENKIRVVTQIFIRPAAPPMYKVDNIDVGYTRNQLQLVGKNEVQPISNADRLKEVDKLVGRKKISNLIHFHVLWKDKTKSWEPRTLLTEYLPVMVREYEKNNKPKRSARNR